MQAQTPTQMSPNKSDAFISMDANASTNTDTNVTKGE